MANDPAYVHPEALVSTEWLAAHLHDANVRLVDATYHLPTAKRDPRAEYTAEHIPGAAFFDIDGISDPTVDLPHMLPNQADFAAAVGALGIGNGDHVVCYDVYGLMSAARAWWMFRIFGHDRVSVLNGGLPKWKREGRPVEAKPVAPARKGFIARFRPELVRSKRDVLANLDSAVEQVLDARAAGRFRGVDPEPRAGLRGGHIPHSANLPYNQLVNSTDQTILPAAELKQRFAAAGIDPAKPIVTSCGSGVTACVLALGLHLVGAEKVAVYDGSWSEWGLPGDTPVVTT
jgi:thiosulfate/3-mercaptopyruvate sulfurtransferase